MSTPRSADLGCHAISRSMLNAYSWSQFGLFILVLVLLYYLVVGLLYYRQEVTALLTPGKKGLRPQLAGAAATVAAPPSLVRPTSAFGPANPTPESQAAQDDEANQPEAGAAENLPTATEPVVAGELPPSTAGATGQDESSSAEAPMEATAAAGSALEEAQAQDETRTETIDEAYERLAALVRREAHQLPPEEEETVLPDPVVGGYEPLATFEEPVASLLDIITAEPSQLVAAESVSEYIAQLQAGQNPPLPPALQGSCLAEQMAQQLDEYQAELAALFAADEV